MEQKPDSGDDQPCNDVAMTEEPRDERPAGNKYYILLSGKTLKSQEDILRNALQQIPGLQEVPTVEECDVVLVFCIIVSRTGTDIDAAVNELNALSESKPAVFMVLHHTFDLEKIVPESSRYVTRRNTFTIDCLFNEDEGFLKCLRNEEALEEIKQWLQLESHFYGAAKGTCWCSTVPSQNCLEQNGLLLVVIYNPFWFGSGLSMEEIKQNIKFCTRLASAGPYAFLLVIPANQFIEEEREIVKDMEVVFEERCWQRLMLVLTVSDEHEKLKIEKHKFLEEKFGNRFLAINISETGSRPQVSELLKKVEEMVAESSDDESYVMV